MSFENSIENRQLVHPRLQKKVSVESVEIALENGRSTRQMLTASGQPFTVANLGKKAAGRLLQGRTWDEFPGFCTCEMHWPD